MKNYDYHRKRNMYFNSNVLNDEQSMLHYTTWQNSHLTSLWGCVIKKPIKENQNGENLTMRL
jgi:hypothetical protein